MADKTDNYREGGKKDMNSVCVCEREREGEGELHWERIWFILFLSYHMPVIFFLKLYLCFSF